MANATTSFTDYMKKLGEIKFSSVNPRPRLRVKPLSQYTPADLEQLKEFTRFAALQMYPQLQR